MEHFEAFFFRVLVQLVAIILAARVGAWLFGKLGQPPVVGEILAGLMLGPSLLGRIHPDWLAFVFPEETALVFRVISEIGLVLFMFLIGTEFDFGHLRQIGRTASGVAVSGIVLPFALGVGLAWAIHPHVASAEVNRTGFVLFVATTLSITAIPILGRIMVELNIQRTRLGTLTITAAAVDDALGWILLAAVSAIVHGGLEWSLAGVMLVETALFVGVVILVVRPALHFITQRQFLFQQGELSLAGMTVVLVAILASAMATNLIGIFSIFGPFVLGAALSQEREFVEAIAQRLRQFVQAFFLPVFFTFTGLRTNVGLLDSLEMWLICGLVVAAAIVGKMAGCGLAARWGGLSWAESGCVAVMMNTRALMGLVAINVGRELGVVPDTVFCMLVLMAVVTTIMATPLLRRMLPTALARETPPAADRAVILPHRA